jgi:hypothetical protein
MEFSPDDASGAGWTTQDQLWATGTGGSGTQDDGCSGDIPLGFTYTGFGASTNVVRVSTNGVLFLGNTCSTVFQNTALPTSISNVPMLFFFWDDLEDFGSGELIKYTTQGSGTGHVFNLYFKSRLHDTTLCSSNPTPIIMITISEASKLVKASYTAINSCASLKGAGATFGFQSSGGAAATPFTIGTDAQMLDDNQGIQSMSFHPPN